MFCISPRLKEKQLRKSKHLRPEDLWMTADGRTGEAKVTTGNGISGYEAKVVRGGDKMVEGLEPVLSLGPESHRSFGLVFLKQYPPPRI